MNNCDLTYDILMRYKINKSYFGVSTEFTFLHHIIVFIILYFQGDEDKCGIIIFSKGDKSLNSVLCNPTYFKEIARDIFVDLCLELI